MSKVIFNDKEIDIVDELDPGYEEFDSVNEIDLDDTIEIKPINEEDYE